MYFSLPGAVFGDYLGLNNPLPVLWTRSVTLAAGAQTTVLVQAPRVPATAAAYEGFIDVTANGATTPEARIPWWFVMPAPAPTSIALDYAPLDLSFDNSTGYYDATIAIRFIDNSGVTFPAPSSISVLNQSGGAVASNLRQASSSDTCESACASVVFPNVWLIDITAPYYAQTGDQYSFQITSGSLTRNFTAYVY